MYRYPADDSVTYTPEDLVLFRGSPFASWMERLSLENPAHGVLPDSGSSWQGSVVQRQDDIADTLRAEGRGVILIDWDLDEPTRRKASQEALRSGADFIVNAQLAAGSLSGAANLLIRTNGYSELGNTLYIPCDTQARPPLHAEFSLCFLADLLQHLQGQMPPQMLVMHGGEDIRTLPTEDHIYYYLAVKKRFMEAMHSFHSHRMPDPAESFHFGRWSGCANQILKQRALAEQGYSPAAAVAAMEEASGSQAAAAPSRYISAATHESHPDWSDSGRDVERAGPDSTAWQANPDLAPVIGISGANGSTPDLPGEKGNRRARPLPGQDSPPTAVQARSWSGSAEGGPPGGVDYAGGSQDSVGAVMTLDDLGSEDEADDTDRDSIAWAAEPADEFETDTFELPYSLDDSLLTDDLHQT